MRRWLLILRDDWTALKFKIVTRWVQFKWKSSWWHKVERVWYWWLAHWEVNRLRTLFLTFAAFWFLSFMCWAVRHHG